MYSVWTHLVYNNKEELDFDFDTITAFRFWWYPSANEDKNIWIFQHNSYTLLVRINGTVCIQNNYDT